MESTNKSHDLFGVKIIDYLYDLVKNDRARRLSSPILLYAFMFCKMENAVANVKGRTLDLNEEELLEIEET